MTPQKSSSKAEISMPPTKLIKPVKQDPVNVDVIDEIEEEPKEEEKVHTMFGAMIKAPEESPGFKEIPMEDTPVKEEPVPVKQPDFDQSVEKPVEEVEHAQAIAPTPHSPKAEEKESEPGIFETLEGESQPAVVEKEAPTETKKEEKEVKVEKEEPKKMEEKVEKKEEEKPGKIEEEKPKKVKDDKKSEPEDNTAEDKQKPVEEKKPEPVEEMKPELVEEKKSEPVEEKKPAEPESQQPPFEEAKPDPKPETPKMETPKAEEPKPASPKAEEAKPASRPASAKSDKKAEPTEDKA